MKSCFDNQIAKEDEVIRKFIVGEPMNYEEIALAKWMIDGRVGKPMTKTGVMKMLKRIYCKMRIQCEKKGISRDIVWDLAARGRMCATSKFSRPECH